MLLVRLEFLRGLHLPSAIFGKESICLRRHIADFSKAEAVGKRESLLINTGSAYDVHLLFSRATGKSLIE